MVKRDSVHKLHSFYEKYGVLTLIFGRFIPFGVRNGLFLTAGIGKMKPLKFALSDLLAASISCTVFFSLYYKYGTSVVEIIKKSNYLIFSVAIIFAIFMIIKNKRAKKST